VKCLTTPTDALIAKVRVIVEEDGLAGVFSDKAVAALEDLARQYGPEAIVCVLRSLLDGYTAPTGMQASPEALARSRRVQAFLNDRDIEVQGP
jgi:isochorismate hydrolase